MKAKTILSILTALILLLLIGAISVSASVSDLPVAAEGILSSTELFTERDLEQQPDTTGARSIVVKDSDEIRITEEGIYVLSGTASGAVIYVEADKEDKIQLVLDSLSISNNTFPCIYILSADKVFITTVSDSSLSVSGTFISDGDTNTDGVIFSKDDLVLNGTGTLTISSTDNGIVCKDDLKITGGSYVIDAASKCMEANDSIRIADGTFVLTAGTDGLHAENDDDDSLGYIYLCGGEFTINAGDDAIHAVSVLQIDEGTFSISGAEGLEATYIQINGGSIDIQSWDDGVNAANKSGSYRTTFEMNAGELSVSMGSGDTDGIDSNGDLYINGGTISVNASSPFDCDGAAQYNGGSVIVNGEQVDYLPMQQGGGGGSRGGRGGW